MATSAADDHGMPAAMFFAAGDAVPHPGTIPRVLGVGSLEIDLMARVATRAGRVLHLHPKQFVLLVYFAVHVNRVVSREAIARDVWGDDTVTWTNVITVHVSGLRKEVDPDGVPALLHTVRGRGYRLGAGPA